MEHTPSPVVVVIVVDDDDTAAPYGVPDVDSKSSSFVSAELREFSVVDELRNESDIGTGTGIAIGVVATGIACTALLIGT